MLLVLNCGCDAEPSVTGSTSQQQINRGVVVDQALLILGSANTPNQQSTRCNLGRYLWPKPSLAIFFFYHVWPTPYFSF